MFARAASSSITKARAAARVRDPEDHPRRRAIKLGLQPRWTWETSRRKRDWGYAREFVEGMWRMLQHGEPADFVLATGTSYSVKDFVALAFDHVGLDWEEYVDYDARYERPTEVDSLIGDASKATTELGWKAQVHVPELVRIMVSADLAALTPED